MRKVKQVFFNQTGQQTKQEADPKEELINFENMKDMGELKALSAYSLEHPLSEEQFKRMMELKVKILEMKGGKVKDE